MAPSSRSDEELVTCATAGDLESFNQLVSRWERPIYALAYRTLGREEDARDVVQEAFLRAFRGLKGFKGQAKFSSWLYRITLNLCRDWIPARAPHADRAAAGRHRPSTNLPDEQIAPTTSVEELVAQRQLSDAVAQAMAELPEEQRSAILLKEYHGLTFPGNCGHVARCPLSTVKTRLYLRPVRCCAAGWSAGRRSRLEASGARRGKFVVAPWSESEKRASHVLMNEKPCLRICYDEDDPIEGDVASRRTSRRARRAVRN